MEDEVKRDERLSSSEESSTLSPDEVLLAQLGYKQEVSITLLVRSILEG